MWGNGLSLLEHNVAPNQICAAGDWLVRNADHFPREGYLSIKCVNSSLRISGQPKNCIDDDVGRTLDKLPDDIEVDPELRTKQRQNK